MVEFELHVGKLHHRQRSIRKIRRRSSAEDGGDEERKSAREEVRVIPRETSTEPTLFGYPKVCGAPVAARPAVAPYLSSPVAPGIFFHGSARPPRCLARNSSPLP